MAIERERDITVRRRTKGEREGDDALQYICMYEGRRKRGNETRYM